MRQPDQAMIPYSANTEILKSCDIRFPLKINLLALRNLVGRLRNEAFQKKKENAKTIRLISFVAPYEPANSDVMNLLQQCQAISPNQPT